MYHEHKVSELIGKTLQSVTQTSDDRIIFRTDEGDEYTLGHHQDCCESVSIESVIGDLDDLIGTPILLAEEATSGENPTGVEKEYPGSFTWTFYKFATIKGYVDIRWYGESNGWYSESVDFDKKKVG